MKKKTKKTILISIVIAIVVICLIVLAVLLRKDVRGLTAFDRSKVIASAGGQSITMGEYAMGLDNTLSYYTQYYGASYTDEEIRTLQDNIVKQLLTQKLAVAKLDELGLSFTAEELAHFKQTAEDQLASLEESIGKQMATSGNFSNASLQTQINEYFTRQLGMSKAKYKSYVESQEKAEHALEKLQTYYASEISGYTEEDLLAYYDQFVQENYADPYTSGAYSMQMYMYQIGYTTTPYLYIPENFIYLDVLSYTCSSNEEASAMLQKYEESGDFEAFSKTEGIVSLHDTLKAPYAVGEDEWGYILGSSDAYDLAKGLEIGETGAVIVPGSTSESSDSAASYVLYIVRREAGTLCENGAQSGIVDIDYYDGVRDTVKSSYESSAFNEIAESWLTDLKISPEVYDYKGLSA